MKIDLHIHTAYSSDGEYSVEKILEMCKETGIKYLSVTDHNTVRGVPEALALAPRLGMQAVAGVELDCVHENRNYHLLGYHFDHTRPEFIEVETDILHQEQNAAEEKITRIRRELGIPLCPEEVLSAENNGVVTGERIAEVLLHRENAKDFPALLPYLPGGDRSDNPYVNFYWDYFSKGKPAYVPVNYLSLREAAALIHAAGGIAVLAHPGQSLRRDALQGHGIEYGLLSGLILTGIDGIEAYSSYHSRTDMEYFADAALRSGLLVTCGSDFHGKTKPAISLCAHRADEKMADLAAALQKAGIIGQQPE